MAKNVVTFLFLAVLEDLEQFGGLTARDFALDCRADHNADIQGAERVREVVDRVGSAAVIAHRHVAQGAPVEGFLFFLEPLARLRCAASAEERVRVMLFELKVRVLGHEGLNELSKLVIVGRLGLSLQHGPVVCFSLDLVENGRCGLGR